MNAEEIEGHLAEHMRNLVRAHGGVRAESGQNRLEPVAVVPPCVAGQLACAGVLAGLIGRDSQHVVARAELGQALNQQIVQLPGRQIGIDASN